ncbi:autotransporter translocation and assembly factor TamB [Marinilabilia salmonicolor]|jgi:autotransporter translocation and assembly factor TamB|uniref:Autotransporter translocation and assembly factor TamB n=2 Tax=Marinilabilia salmonicolor TaxID=989 RepID=A0A2T0XTN1_9BACT|nr:autotransporter translocation and assembly factor TamB [Marinilabilia salmonicolor]RCW30624.1 autotransporter translocation and assembly factor TamB [Marinilabilia salmonicolor]
MLFNMQKLIKYIVFFFAGLIVLVLLLLLFTQTSVFRGIVRSQVVKIANEQLDGEVKLEKVEGSFFSSLSLQGLWVGETEGDTLLAFDRLSLRYSLWPLLTGKVFVASIDIENPVVNVVQYPDSSWNFQNIFPESEEKQDTSSASPEMSFELGVFNLSNGRINVSMSDTMVPGYLSNLNIEVGGRYSPGEMKVDLRHLGFQTPEGVTDVKHFQAGVGLRDSVWSVQNLALVTSLNRVDFKGSYAGLDSLSGDLDTEPVHLEEFAWVMPDFRLGVTPRVDFKSTVANSHLNLELEVAWQDQKIGVQGSVQNFPDALRDSLRHQAELDLQVDIQNMNPEQWLVLSDLPLILNGVLNISGNGLAGSTQPLRLTGDLSGTRWQEYQLEEFEIDGSFLDGQTEVKAGFLLGLGSFDLEASANLNQDKGPVAVKLDVTSFPADRFLPEWGDSTLLNLKLKAEGTGTDFASLDAGFSFLMHQSLAAGVSVDSLLMSGRIQQGSVLLDTMRFQNSSMSLNARGSYDKQGELSSDFDVTLRDLTAFSRYVDQPVSWKMLEISGTANGRADSLMTDVLMHSDSLVYDTVATVGALRLKADGFLSSKGFSGIGDLRVKEIRASGQEADSLDLKATLGIDDWDAQLNLWLPDSLSLNTRILGNMSMPFRFQIPKLDIFTPYEQFSLAGKGPTVLIDSVRMSLDSLRMIARQNSAFKLTANGKYIPGDSVSSAVSIDQFDLSLIEKFLEQDLPLSGMASLKILADGSLSNPVLDFKMRMDSLEAYNARIKELDVGVSHKSDTLRASLLIRSNQDDSIMANGFSVVNVNLTDSQMVSTLKTINGEIVANKVRPSAFFVFDNQDEQLLKALLDMDVKVSGEVVSPVMRGFIRLTNGRLSWPAYGISYSDLKLVANLDSNSVVIDSLFARSEKGSMLVKGDLAFDSTFVSGNLADADVSVKADEFFLSRHRNHEIQINSDLWVRMKDEIPEFGGDLTVLRSSFYLPAILDMGGSSDINEPMLVRALEQQNEDTLLVRQGDTLRISRRDSLPSSDMVKSLTGRLNVKIPRNTWIKSEDMNLELYGDFDLLKNNAYFEIFGSLGISRGYYTLYGRKLIIQEGELNFQGGEEINPRVNLEASYQFRGKDKQKNELIMKAAGTAFEPNLSFTLNGSSITERDAMAYLIFNQSFDELSFGNQQGVSGNVPSAMLSGLVSSQLTKTIGNTFNLDMVEVQAGDNWESATFMVGKYITNNLFVTYQRGFGENEDESLTPQTITLEYEVTRNLFLRLTQGDVKDSGVDVILKFEKKK